MLTNLWVYILFKLLDDCVRMDFFFLIAAFESVVFCFPCKCPVLCYEA